MLLLWLSSSAHYTQTLFNPPIDCASGQSYRSQLASSCPATEDFVCRFACASAFTALQDYAALCDASAAEDASFRRVERVCPRLEPWKINGAPLTKLECDAAEGAPDGKDAHLAEVRAACGALAPGGGVCPDSCREPFTVLANFYHECHERSEPEHDAAREAGCTPLVPKQHETCACAAAAGNWSISCYNEEAMERAARALRANGCDEMVANAPRCAAVGSACYDDFQLVQAHHDHCRSADIPAIASDAFHDFVGVCSECHVLRDKMVGLPHCAAVADCADTTAAEDAYAALSALEGAGHGGGSGAARGPTCALSCGSHYATLQAYHDGCEGIERTSAAVRDGFHRFSSLCERAGCNSLQGWHDPNRAEACARPSAAELSWQRTGGGGPSAGRTFGLAVLVLLLLAAVVGGVGLAARRSLAARGLALEVGWGPSSTTRGAPALRVVPAAGAPRTAALLGGCGLASDSGAAQALSAAPHGGGEGGGLPGLVARPKQAASPAELPRPMAEVVASPVLLAIAQD